ncbi:MAG: hypothetical protein AAGJ79_13470 [Verrucomicrobiota bacterium]
MIVYSKTLLHSAVVLLSTASLLADERSPLEAGYVHKFESGVDGGGDVSSDFFHLTGRAPLVLRDEFLISVSASYYFNDYSFSGGPTGSFASLKPWDSVHTFQVGGFTRWKFAENWELFAIPSIRSTGEGDADLSDTLSGGSLVGFSYTFSDRLKLGPGFGYITQLEDDASIFPIILVDWKITDALSLSTGPTVGASLGPGLSLNHQVTDSVRLSVGARYERFRFRLDKESRVSPNGIGEEKSVPVFAAIGWQATEFIEATILGGVGFGNELNLEDEQGSTIADSDYDTSPFLGVNFKLTF